MAIDRWRIRLKVLAAFLKVCGLAVFGISLGLIILFSILQVFWTTEWLTLGLIAGIVLIILGVLTEKVT